MRDQKQLNSELENWKIVLKTQRHWNQNIKEESMTTVGDFGFMSVYKIIIDQAEKKNRKDLKSEQN